MAKEVRKKAGKSTVLPGAPPSEGWDDGWTQEQIRLYEAVPLVHRKDRLFALCTQKELKGEGLLKFSDYKSMAPELRHAYANMAAKDRRVFAARYKRGKPPAGWKEIVSSFRLELRAKGAILDALAATRFLHPHIAAIERAESKQAERDWELLEPSPLEELLEAIAVGVALLAQRSVTTHNDTTDRYAAIAAAIRNEEAKCTVGGTKPLGWGGKGKVNARVINEMLAAGDRKISGRTIARVRKRHRL